MTNEILKEILIMVLEDESSGYLCDRLVTILSFGNINHSERIYVKEYMFARKPNSSDSSFWWGVRPFLSNEYGNWLQQKHDWLQKLIDEL